MQGSAGIRETLIAPVEYRPGSWLGAPPASRRPVGGWIRFLVRDHSDREGRGKLLGRADGEELGNLRDRVVGDGVRAFLALLLDLLGAAHRMAAAVEHLGQRGGKQVADGREADWPGPYTDNRARCLRLANEIGAQCRCPVNRERTDQAVGPGVG